MKSAPFARAAFAVVLLVPSASAQRIDVRFPCPFTPGNADPLAVTVVHADLNLDGRLDVVACSVSSQSVLLGAPHGTFVSHPQGAPLSGTVALGAGDFDGDGRPDLVHARQQFDTVSVRFGDGLGGFSATGPDLVTPAPVDLVVADVDGDGNQDVVSVRRFTASPIGFDVRFGDGTGAFPASVFVPSASAYAHVSTGDWDQDGAVDLVFGVLSPSAIVAVPQLAPRVFGAAISLTTPIAPDRVALVDVTADTRPDLLYQATSGVILHRSIGPGSFTGGVQYGTTTSMNTLSTFAVEDADGDSDLDLLLPTSWGIELRRNDGIGVFGAPTLLTSGIAYGRPSVRDVDGDGWRDIVSSTGNAAGVALLLGTGPGTFDGASRYGAGTVVASMVIADLDLDGRPDAVIGKAGGNAPAVLLGNGTGFQPLSNLPAVFSYPQVVCVGDFAENGFPDVLATFPSSTSSSLFLYRNSGCCGFQSPSSTGVPFGAQQIGVGDWNADNHLDVALVDRTTGSLRVLHGTGAGTFGAPSTYATGGQAADVVVADVNSDGFADILVTQDQAGVVLVFLGDGTGVLNAPTPWPVSGAGPLVVADVDGDGLRDLVVGAQGLRVSRNLGGGTFGAASSWSIDPVVRDVAVGDLDGDGRLDVAGACDGYVVVAYGDGLGGAASVERYATGALIPSVAIADVNADQRPEVLALDAALQSIVVLPNQRSWPGVGQNFCGNDGTGLACPCGNESTYGGGAGCANSLGTGGRLVLTGTPSVANDTLLLTGTGMPDGPALYFQGDVAIAGGAGVTFGDGLRCAGGTVVRLATRTNALGTSQVPSGGSSAISLLGGAASGHVRVFQVWYRDAATFCTPAVHDMTNAVRITWRP